LEKGLSKESLLIGSGRIVTTIGHIEVVSYKLVVYAAQSYTYQSVGSNGV